MSASRVTSGPGDRQLEPYRRELTGYCYRMLGSIHDAEDAVQDTMLCAWRALPTFEDRVGLRPWLYRIATNVCLDLLKSRSRRALPVEVVPAATGELCARCRDANTFDCREIRRSLTASSSVKSRTNTDAGRAMATLHQVDDITIVTSRPAPVVDARYRRLLLRRPTRSRRTRSSCPAVRASAPVRTRTISTPSSS
jgi:RNA polymerase sigma factor (sigma-70 family)